MTAVVDPAHVDGEQPARACSLTGDTVTDAVVPAAMALVWAVRTSDVEAIDEALTGAAEATSGDGIAALAVVLAAMVPDDRSPGGLLAWLRAPSEYLDLRQHGLGADAAINVLRLHHNTCPVEGCTERRTQ